MGSPLAEVLLTASVSPSESREKVKEAAINLLGDCDYKIEDGADAIAIASRDPRCLQVVHDQLRDRRVRDAARRLLLRSRDGETVSLNLNRQAAYIGIVALCGSGAESPLGPLVLTISSTNPDELVDWLTAH